VAAWKLSQITAGNAEMYENAETFLGLKLKESMEIT
jgi:hypothetical protein